jgi:CheY-like chemotaxis protein
MSTELAQNQTSRTEIRRFKQLLAQYRARVHETNYRTFFQPELATKQLVETRREKPTILVIEDNIDEWLLIRYGLLRQFAEVECRWLANATELTFELEQYAQLETELPRFVLLDLYLPNTQTGFQVLQALKAHPLFQSIPAIVFSHSAEPANIAQAFAYSASAYLIKPTDAREWLSVFAELEPYWH